MPTKEPTSQPFRINRIRVHDFDTKRREYAIQQAHMYDGMIHDFIKYCQLKGIPEHEMLADLPKLEELRDTWVEVADQSKID